jgi:hypothetical protein
VTVIHHYTQLFIGWNEVLQTFCLGWSQTAFFSVFAQATRHESQHPAHAFKLYIYLVLCFYKFSSIDIFPMSISGFWRMLF